ncbi:hypothetical protein RUND412_011333, partial [Rhizina undulata]
MHYPKLTILLSAMAALTAAAPLAPISSDLLIGGLLPHSGPAQTGPTPTGPALTSPAPTGTLQQRQESDIPAGVVALSGAIPTDALSPHGAVPTGILPPQGASPRVFVSTAPTMMLPPSVSILHMVLSLPVFVLRMGLSLP